MRDDEDVPWWGRGHNEAGGTPCPVCGQNVPGDEDVVEAHVDSCLAHLRITEVQASQSREADMEMDIDVEGGILAGVNFRGACEHLSGQCSVCDRMSIGTGFDIRDRTQQDVEDEVDVDGEDEVLFGAAQFTENDILAVSGQHESEDEDDDVDVGTGDIVETSRDTAQTVEKSDDNAAKALKELLVEGKVVKRHVDDVKRAMDEVMGVGEAEEVEQAIERARKQNDQVALIQALENKVNLLVSIIPVIHASSEANLQMFLGIITCLLVDFTAVSHMFGPIYRTYRLNRLLAYLLSGMLATLFGLDEDVPDMQANHGCCGFAASILMIAYLLDLCILLCMSLSIPVAVSVVLLNFRRNDSCTL